MERRISADRTAALLRSLPSEGAPAYRSISDGLRLLVSDGRIAAGTRLPSERELTDALGVSRTTVTRAYAELRGRGYLTSRQGSGSVTRIPTVTAVSDMLLSPGADGDPNRINLTCAAPPAPPGVAQAYEGAVRELTGHYASQGYFPSGVPALREIIARRYAERGLETDPEQVLVTTGGLAALSIVMRAFVGHGERVLMESPSYPNAIMALRAHRARIVSADIDQTGWATSSLVDTVRQAHPGVAYLMPDWHNPTGQLMSDEERAALAGALRRAGTLAVIDETTAELGIDDVPAPLPFAAHLPGAVTLGSASKSLWGGLRIGWVRVPRDLVPELLAARLTLDLGAAVLEQLATLSLLERRAEVMGHRREQLGASRSALATALAAQLPAWRFRIPAGGLSLWVELPRPASTALANAAAGHGLQLAPGPLFAPEGGLERYLRLPFTQPPAVMEEAVRRLAATWEGLTPPTRGAQASSRAHRSPALVT